MICQNCKAAVSGNFCNICGHGLNRESISNRWLWVAIPVLLGALVVRNALAPAPAPSNANQPARPKPVEGSVIQSSGTAICADTEQGFDEIVKWQSLGDKDEVLRAMLRYGASFITRGDTLKLLESGLFKQRVRVLKTGRECWVAREVIDP